MDQLYDEVQSFDTIASELMSTHLSTIFSMHSMVEYVDSSDDYRTAAAINSARADSITPEELSRRLCIGLKTAACTLKGLLSKRFRTDKSQLRYKQLSCQYGTFYTDFLKVAVKSIRGYIGGVLYTNKVGFKKFFPCESEKGEETSRSIRSFIEMVGLPYSLHSDHLGKGPSQYSPVIGDILFLNPHFAYLCVATTLPLDITSRNSFTNVHPPFPSLPLAMVQTQNFIINALRG